LPKEESLEDICTRLIPQELTIEILHINAEVKTILVGFLNSHAYAELKRVNIVGREAPFTISWNEQIMDGVIDLIYEDGDKLFLADYKTDRVSDAEIEERIKEYSLSGEIYTEAARRCLKRDIHGFKLIFLRLGKFFDLKLFDLKLS
jgi:ATP-dependent exoDNAse (exonuclease V) beta subunit